MIYYGCWAIVKRKGKMLKKISNSLLKVKKFNVQNTLGDVNITLKMMYERRKTNQLNYYPVLKL